MAICLLSWRIIYKVLAVQIIELHKPGCQVGKCLPSLSFSFPSLKVRTKAHNSRLLHGGSDSAQEVLQQLINAYLPSGTHACALSHQPPQPPYFLLLKNFIHVHNVTLPNSYLLFSTCIFLGIGPIVELRQPTRRHTFEGKWLSLSQQPAAANTLRSWWHLRSSSPLHAEMWTGLIMCRCCASNHSCCESICKVALSCPEHSMAAFPYCCLFLLFNPC